MAHLVKCLYCGQQFDTDKEEWVKPNARRYAHKHCAEKSGGELINTVHNIEEKGNNNDHRIFFDCINSVCKGRCEVDWAVVTKEEKRLLKEGYTLSGLTKTFYYVYEVIKQPLPEKVNMLFILERYFDEAKEYYKNVFFINKKNKENIHLDDKPVIIETQIKSYQPKIKFFDIGE
jgi:hypothetical protein